MDQFAAICEQVNRYPGRLRKVRVLADYFRRLPDMDLVRAVRFLCCGPLAGAEESRLSIGYATLSEAALAATGWDEATWRICVREVGDPGETIALLMPGRTEGLPLPLARAEEHYRELAAARNAADRTAILAACFTRYRPLAIKYFVKVITGELRIGLQAKMVEEAVAAATGVPLRLIRDANNRSGDLPAIALAAREGSVETIQARLFRPMDFMLAKPLDKLSDLPSPEDWIIEDKYDGIRAQIHAAEGRVVIFTRGFGEVTASFPEVASRLEALPESAVIDGEIVGWRDGRALPFALLQQRIARKKLSADLLEAVPAALIAYDLMYHRGHLLLDLPVEERRTRLEHLAAGGGFLVSPQRAARTSEEVDRQFHEARGRGNEGLVLKRRGSLYEAGRRSGAWLKVKRPYATLDVVVTAAQQGSGRRATVLSDLTFGVRGGERYVNVGKAYSGLTDEEIREMTAILRGSATNKFGPVLVVRPEVVLEVAFDGIQKSSRHKSGYALRFPRIVRWRKDKRPEDADTLERVKELYDASISA